MGSLHIASEGLVSGSDAERVLVECASRNAFAQIGLPTSGYTCGAICWEYRDGRLILTLDQDADLSALTIFGLCSLFIVHESPPTWGWVAYSRCERARTKSCRSR